MNLKVDEGALVLKCLCQRASVFSPLSNVGTTFSRVPASGEKIAIRNSQDCLKLSFTFQAMVAGVESLGGIIIIILTKVLLFQQKNRAQ